VPREEAEQRRGFDPEVSPTDRAKIPRSSSTICSTPRCGNSIRATPSRKVRCLIALIGVEADYRHSAIRGIARTLGNQPFNAESKFNSGLAFPVNLKPFVRRTRAHSFVR
jgi:hypothetical protein